MRLYEIPQAIENLIDPETGEITDVEELTRLTSRFENGLEWLALEVKNAAAEAEALKKEKESFAKRQQTAENRAKSLKNYLANILNGEKFKTDKVVVSFRKSEAVEIGNEFQDWAMTNGQYLRVKTEIDKASLKEDLKAGKEIPFAKLVTNQSIQIK